MKILRPGDPCPCCGRPIKSKNPDVLRLLTLIAERRAFPSAEEIAELKRKWEDEDGRI